jgi:hypothetical protein
MEVQMKSKEFIKENPIKAKDGSTLECLHPNLTMEPRRVSSGKDFIEANFIVCPNCGEIIAHVPKQPQIPKQNPALPLTVNTQLKNIIDMLNKIIIQQNNKQP